MNWQQLLSAKRFGMEEYQDGKHHDRTDFQRDFDRLIFSSPFRRLQNKTQVFPLPGSVFVHNRLTHSMEVSCVGRSLGMIIGKELRKKYPASEADFEEISSIVAAGCLAHDLGNPPFGHSGERAITSYFSEGKGKQLEAEIREQGGRWEDFTTFEGNANSIRMLIHQFNGRRRGGFVLTYSMLASIAKYPYSSVAGQGKGKFGFFQAEEEDFRKIADTLGMRRIQESPLTYCRHPLVYLVEAADDICYKIMDIEDAHKLGLLSTEQTVSLFMNFFPEQRQEKMRRTMRVVHDTNEQIAYLRSSVIGLLVDECVRVFMDNEELILEGKFEGALIKHISELPNTANKNATAVSVAKIYKTKDVVDIELAGHRIIGFLLDTFISAMQSPQTEYSKLILSRIPEQFYAASDSTYDKVMSVLDFVSGMTDVYALDLYRKITGMSLPTV
ncbi:dGTPase [Dysgonomonas sp. PFB1-18]|uniref:deoxyguanosinetriphosphate triphosphohydrolase n=1 Tax=unclassified Dysgonomonas TaxID=2630389 RepID=UPI0024756121|nr:MULTISPECIES: deoxyguanosinetriphosphate triphosphohydrolase [unclassified Dysgonomonas]MDH6307553.1 dGTPase [Dysgonomonas sp. PF1-14]MDH6337471.1 dGTPase [Dysgonomonas sp. PF1-16]MDH6378696.1 dGTPase [Dysgonomonas sp. PFB1-18]MDH6399114.1 dGTPase [Dysgonomonas sp. PF1-23]